MPERLGSLTSIFFTKDMSDLAEDTVFPRALLNCIGSPEVLASRVVIASLVNAGVMPFIAAR